MLEGRLLRQNPRWRGLCTWMAPLQSLGSEVMVSVETAQPSRPESLWSSSMATKGGSAWTYRLFRRNCSTLSMMRTCTAQKVNYKTAEGVLGAQHHTSQQVQPV